MRPILKLLFLLITLSSAILFSACASPPADQLSPTPAQSAAPTSNPTNTTTAVPAPTNTTAATNTSAATTTLVSTATSAPTTTATSSVTGNAGNGKALFAAQPCNSCHDISHPFPGGEVCPNLGNIATEADRIVRSPDYHGQAKDAAGYIRESIVNPDAYIVPGDLYHTDDGHSRMLKNFAQILKPSEIDDLVAFLMQHQ